MSNFSICVLGLGYVGLPTACILTDHGYMVLGVDIDKNVIKNLKSSNYSNSEPELQNLLCKAISNNKIQLSTEIIAADIYIITVPTPLDAKYKPDISYVKNAIESIIPYIKSGDLVIIESTCPIGTTALMAEKILSVHKGVYVAYCPERVLPGNMIHELIHNNRVVGGIDKASTTRAAEFYRSFISGEISYTDAKTAEAVKLAENTYRDINIAYANELSMIANKLNIDVNQIIKLANNHPRVDILEPGIGVGGHCIAIDPYFLIFSAPIESNLITSARKVNEEKSNWVVSKISTIAKQKNIRVISCLGLTYKPNISDIRNSPAIKIIQLLEKEFEVLAVDPYVKYTCSLEQALDKAQMVVTLVAHNQFIHISAKLPNNTIYLDFTGNCK